MTAFVGTTLALRVLLIEEVLAAADRQVAAYQAGRVPNSDLATTLSRSAWLVDSASQAFRDLVPPIMEPAVSVQLRCLDENLFISGDQLAALLQEAAGAVARNGAAEAIDTVAHRSRVHTLVRVLRRAKGWLESVDYETGVHIRLPDFAGGRSLEQQLNLG